MCVCVRVCVCVPTLCNINFHTIYLSLSPSVLVCFHFGSSFLSPWLTLLVTQTWEPSSTRTCTTSRPPLTIPRSLLTLTLSIAARPRKYSGILRLRPHWRAHSATTFGLSPLGIGAPQRRLHVPLCNVLPVKTNSDVSTLCAKVLPLPPQYITTHLP